MERLHFLTRVPITQLLERKREADNRHSEELKQRGQWKMYVGQAVDVEAKGL